jgi:unsaturated rhamnogalacturonyl hydrolase
MKSTRIVLCILSTFAIFTYATADEFAPDSITKIMKKVAQYRLSHGVNHLANWFGGGTNWDAGAYMSGVCALYRHTKEKPYLDSIVKFGVYGNWTPTGGGDPSCCAQTYCESYIFANDTTKKYMYQPWLSQVTADYLNKSPNGSSYWWWCDLLYMVPPGLAMVSSISGQTRILDSLYKCWWQDAKSLYSDTFHLYWRDAGYKPPKLAANGKPIFWAPGEAWVLGGQARVLKYTPRNYRGRDSMIAQFRDQLQAVIELQQGDGLWTTSLLDSVQFPIHETSSTAFFCFAMAWGINNKVLDSATFTPAMRRAWSGLVKSVAANGMLMYCQTVGQEPGNNMFTDYSSSEGEGAFLLAGEEMYKRVTGQVGAVSPSPAKLTEATSQRVVKSVVRLSGKGVGTITMSGNETTIEAYDLNGKLVAKVNPSRMNKIDIRELNGGGRSGVIIIKTK